MTNWKDLIKNEPEGQEIGDKQAFEDDLRTMEMFFAELVRFKNTDVIPYLLSKQTNEDLQNLINNLPDDIARFKKNR